VRKCYSANRDFFCVSIEHMQSEGSGSDKHEVNAEVARARTVLPRNIESAIKRMSATSGGVFPPIRAVSTGRYTEFCAERVSIVSA
jgi:hypothetical protein